MRTVRTADPTLHAALLEGMLFVVKVIEGQGDTNRGFESQITPLLPRAF